MKNKKEQIKYFFDREADVLYFTKREPSPRDISQEVGEGIIVRIEPGTRKVVGFTILNFLRRQMRAAIKLPLSAEFELVG